MTLLLVIFMLFTPLAAHAQFNIWQGRNPVTCNLSGENSSPCTFCDLVKVASNSLDVMRNLAFSIAVLAIAAGAIMMMVSAGNPGRFGTGKSIMMNAIIGVVITLVAWIIVNTVLHLLTGEINLPWENITC